MSKKSDLVRSIARAAAVLAAVVAFIIAGTNASDAFAALHRSVADATGQPNLPPWITATGLLISLAIVVLSAGIPRWTRRWREDRVRRGQEQARELLEMAERGRHFRLDPLPPPADDKAPIVFNRADGQHEAILAWIRGSNRPVLYVLGFSGCGKSSLMGAFVVPSLCREGIGLDGRGESTIVGIMVRAFGDLDATLREELGRPGRIWDSPPDLSGESARTLLERVGKRLSDKGRRLVLVFDQFEEVLVGDSTEEHATSPAVRLVVSLHKAPIPGVRCVLVARAEYGKDFEPLGLPPRIERETFMEVPPFSVADAARAIHAGLARIHGNRDDNATVAAALAREAEALGKIPQNVTPIALNMTGFMYESDPAMGRRLAGGGVNAIEGVLPTYVRSRIESGDIRDIGPAVLGRLVSESGDRQQPAEVSALTGTTRGNSRREGGLDPRAAETTLLTLARHGLVRRVGPKWEVSHDFLAPLIRRALDGITASIWRRLRPWLPVPVAALLILAGVGLWGVGQWQRAEDSNAFNACAQYDHTRNHVSVRAPLTRRAVRHMTRIHKIDSIGFVLRAREVDASLRQLAERSAPLESLKTLNLSHTDVSDDGLRALASPEMGLKALEALILSNTEVSNNGLRALANPGTGLTTLVVLDLSWTGVSDDGLRALASPETGLKALKTLDLRVTRVSDCGLSALGSPETGLKALNMLNLSLTGATDNGIEALRVRSPGMNIVTDSSYWP
ncbi:MAG: hypothetical protein NCW75_07060 [Phycisphaera sp.]|nr:MAG: hypothetical protein NCW75_07060 [Phycisphaera sp.]